MQSGAHDLHAGLVLEDLGLSGLFDTILLSEEEGLEKPHPDLFARALNRVNQQGGLSIRTDQCLHVGDDLAE